MPNMSRREFVAVSAAAALAAASQGAAPAAESMKPPVVIFSKHLNYISDFTALARKAKDLGADGLDLTVRPGGHVTPDVAVAVLPQAVEAIRAEGVDVHMITTNLKSGDEAEVAPTVEAAAKAGVKYMRVGPHKYDATASPLEQLPAFTEQLRSLAKLAEENGVTAGYHNHSGYDYVGAPLWDLHRIITEIGADNFGSNFDMGHASVEGAYGVWQTNTRLMAPHIKMLAAKDFVWEDGKPRWVSLGTGNAKTEEMLKIIRTTGFAGPISIHFEYKTESNEALEDEMKKAVAALRNSLRQAGY